MLGSLLGFYLGQKARKRKTEKEEQRLENFLASLSERERQTYELKEAGLPDWIIKERMGKSPEEEETERQAKLKGISRRWGMAPESEQLLDILGELKTRLAPGAEKGIYAEHIPKGEIVTPTLKPYLKPVTEKAKAKLGEGERLDEALYLAEQGKLTDPRKRIMVKRKGFDPDTGEKIEKKKDWEFTYRQWTEEGHPKDKPGISEPRRERERKLIFIRRKVPKPQWGEAKRQLDILDIGIPSKEAWKTKLKGVKARPPEVERGGFYGATTLSELEQALRDVNFSEEQIKRIKADAIKAGLK